MFRRLFFALQYLFFDPPWDTGISPPELMRFIEKHPPGRALDLGCGTGTNVITLAEHGWQATGVDYVPWAIRAGRRKARRAGVEKRVTFQVGDVLELELDEKPFDLILDIGCFHSFAGGEVERYAQVVQRLLAREGSLLMYAHLQRGPSAGHGASERGFQILKEDLSLIWRQDGEEGEGRPSAWLEFQRHPRER